MILYIAFDIYAITLQICHHVIFLLFYVCAPTHHAHIYICILKDLKYVYKFLRVTAASGNIYFLHYTPWVYLVIEMVNISTSYCLCANEFYSAIAMDFMVCVFPYKIIKYLQMSLGKLIGNNHRSL